MAIRGPLQVFLFVLVTLMAAVGIWLIVVKTHSEEKHWCDKLKTKFDHDKSCWHAKTVLESTNTTCEFILPWNLESPFDFCTSFNYENRQSFGVDITEHEPRDVCSQCGDAYKSRGQHNNVRFALVICLVIIAAFHFIFACVFDYNWAEVDYETEDSK